MATITAVFCEFLVMVALLVAIWFIGKREGINGEKSKQDKARVDAVARGLDAGRRARTNFELHKK